MPGCGLSLTLFTLFILYFSTLLQSARAVLKNVSIDDQTGDWQTGVIPKYAPQHAWADQACRGCAIKPDANQLFGHTATAATFMSDGSVSPITVDFDFNGTAIYIYFTLFYNEGNGITVNTECNFTVDNEPPVFFNHTGDPTIPALTKRDYRALVFSKAGLKHQPHHMQIRMSDVPYHVFLSFDYAEYTVDEVVGVPTKLTTGSSIPTTGPSIPTTGSSIPTIGLIGPTESNNFPPPVDSPEASSSSKTSEPAVSLLILGGSIFQLVKAMFMG